MSYHYYVLVFTDTKPLYVTDVKNLIYIHYEEDKIPKELRKSFAEDVAFELNSRGIKSVVVISRYVIDKHPYPINSK